MEEEQRGGGTLGRYHPCSRQAEVHTWRGHKKKTLLLDEMTVQFLNISGQLACRICAIPFYFAEGTLHLPVLPVSWRNNATILRVRQSFFWVCSRRKQQWWFPCWTEPNDSLCSSDNKGRWMGVDAVTDCRGESSWLQCGRGERSETVVKTFSISAGQRVQLPSPKFRQIARDLFSLLTRQ